MSPRQLLLYFGTAILLLAAQNTSAQTPTACAPRTVVVERLASKFNETRRSIALSRTNVMVEVFASDTSGSWTMIATKANGISCLIASGTAYETIAVLAPTKGEKT